MDLERYFKTQVELYKNANQTHLVDQLMMAWNLLYSKTISVPEFMTIVRRIEQEYASSHPRMQIERVKLKARPKAEPKAMAKAMAKAKPVVVRTFRDFLAEDFKRRVLLACQRVLEMKERGQAANYKRVKLTTHPAMEMEYKSIPRTKKTTPIIVPTESYALTVARLQNKKKQQRRRKKWTKQAQSMEKITTVDRFLLLEALQFGLVHPVRPEDAIPKPVALRWIGRIQ